MVDGVVGVVCVAVARLFVGRGWGCPPLSCPGQFILWFIYSNSHQPALLRLKIFDHLNKQTEPAASWACAHHTRKWNKGSA